MTNAGGADGKEDETRKRKRYNLLTARGVGRRATAAVHTSIVVHMLTRRVSLGVYTPPALVRKRQSALLVSSSALPASRRGTAGLHSHEPRAVEPTEELNSFTTVHSVRDAAACIRTNEIRSFSLFTHLIPVDTLYSSISVGRSRGTTCLGGLAKLFLLPSLTVGNLFLSFITNPARPYLPESTLTERSRPRQASQQRRVTH